MTNKKERMKKGEINYRGVFVILLFVLLISFVYATNISIFPPTQQVHLGEDFDVNITIDDVLDLYSFQFDLFYDPVVLQYVSSAQGTFLNSDGATTFPIPPNTSTSGLLDNMGISRIISSTGIDGSGLLAILTFRAITEGDSNLTFANTYLFDSNDIQPQEIVHDVNDGNVSVVDCDVDGDGYYSQILCGGSDCDDYDNLEFPGQIWYKDSDGDGYSDGTTTSQCLRPLDYKAEIELIAISGDCDDNNGNINPGVSEICDGIDNDCVNGVDDIFTAENCEFVCTGAGYNYNPSRPFPLTCCGNNAATFEDNPFEDPEVSCYDGNDNDCDSFIDIFDSDCSGICGVTGVENSIWVSGTGDCNQCFHDGDDDGDQFDPLDEFLAYPGMADMCDNDCGIVAETVIFSKFESGNEVTCDGIDNDCDGIVDDDGVKTRYYRDFDGDSYGDINVYEDACTPSVGYVLDNTDCDDNDGDEYPGQIWFSDYDGDFYSDGTTIITCSRPLNYYLAIELVATSGDCDDNDINVNPGEIEICNNIDDNCDTNTDEGFTAEECEFVCQGLGYDYSAVRVGDLRCCGNGANEASPFQDPEADCYDLNDNDCDGLVDIYDSDCSGECLSIEDSIWVSGTGDCDQCDHVGDDDGDQLGWSSVDADVCDSDCGTVLTTVNQSVYQFPIETACDLIDNDCDGVVDDDGVKTTYYMDFDGDGYGNENFPLDNCTQPVGYVLDSTDCDDGNSDEYPGQIWYKDFDGDDYSDGTTWEICEQPTNYYLARDLNATSGDCDDDVAAVNPGASEVCNNIDDNCDTNTDEGFDAEECEFVCQGLGFNYDGSRVGDLRCCGNGPTNENNPYQITEANCTDNSDNDCDGFIDLFDSDCSGECTNNAEDDFWVSGTGDCNQCNFDYDNDGDQPGDWSVHGPGSADRCDSDCGLVTSTINLTMYETNEMSCYNDLDDDCDGLVDAYDDDCYLVRYDVDDNGFVDIGDMSMVGQQFGAFCFSPDYCGGRDVNRDFEILIDDLQLIGQHFT